MSHQRNIDRARFPRTVALLARWGHCTALGRVKRARNEIMPSCCALAARMGSSACPICLAAVHPDACYLVTDESGRAVGSPVRGNKARERANMVAAALEAKHGAMFDVRLAPYKVRNPNGTTSTYTPVSVYNDRPTSGSSKPIPKRTDSEQFTPWA